MAQPTPPTVSIANQDIGPAIVTYGTKNIGGTLDNVVITHKIEKAPMKMDQFGTTTVDEAISGYDITVTTSIVETRDKTIVAAVFPNADFSGTSPTDTLTWNNKVSIRDYTQALPLTVHPMSEDSADENKDWYFWLAFPTEDSSLTLGPTEQFKMKVVFRVFPDVTVSPARFFRYGDKDL